MRYSRSKIAGSIAVIALLGGCTNDQNEQQELAELRLEIEQLTNALGRLEFRVYELENQLNLESGTNGETADAAVENADAVPAPATPRTQEPAAGRFDLTPAE
jgi:hypothetical protein